MYGHWDVSGRSGVPERCHASGAAVDARRDTPAWTRQAERAADGDGVDVPQGLHVSPVHCAFLHNAFRDLTPIVPATAGRQRNDVERYCRSRGRKNHRMLPVGMP